MKKSLKAISQSMKVSARCQMRTIENWDESLGIQKRNLALNLENLSFARDATAS